jgi:hypothetical protein
MATPSEVGAQAELAVATALTRAGCFVFVPFFSSHSRGDLIYLDDDGVPRRVQCKTSQLRHGCIMFRTCSNTKNIPKVYDGEIDLFGVYSPALERVYLVPIEDVPTRYAALRIEPTLNGQSDRVRWADQYLLGPP